MLPTDWPLPSSQQKSSGTPFAGPVARGISTARTSTAPPSLAPESAAGVGGSLNLVEQRVLDAVEVASDFQVRLELEALWALLPEEGPPTVEALAAWIRAHPTLGRLDESRVLPARRMDLPMRPDRELRADHYHLAAERLVRSDLWATLPWVRFIGVTGSAAYGKPAETDDCDLMAIVRPGTVWLFLAYAFLRLRLRRPLGGPPGEPRWCLNYVLDDPAARRQYSRPRGFLFAREALSVRPVRGEGYYRQLLEASDWLREEVPRLYARWGLHPSPAPADPFWPPWPVRALNALTFPVLAAYLQFKGLWTNHRFNVTGRGERSFRTITRVDRMVLATRKFEQLGARWASANRLTPE